MSFLGSESESGFTYSGSARIDAGGVGSASAEWRRVRRKVV